MSFGLLLGSRLLLLGKAATAAGSGWAARPVGPGGCCQLPALLLLIQVTSPAKRELESSKFHSLPTSILKVPNVEVLRALTLSHQLQAFLHPPFLN